MAKFLQYLFVALIFVGCQAKKNSKESTDSTGSSSTPSSQSHTTPPQITDLAPSLMNHYYSGPQTLEFYTTLPGVQIYYTTDGSTPTSSSTRYTGAITISTSLVIKVILIDSEGQASEVATYTYIIDTAPPEASTISNTTQISATGFTLNWEEANDNENGSLSYYVCSGINAAALNTIEKCLSATEEMPFTENVTSLLITGKDPETTYYYNIIVRDAAGNMSLYEGISVTTSAGGGAVDTTAPVAGSFQPSTDVTTTAMTLNWTAATDNVTATTDLEYFVCSGPSLGAIDTVEKCLGATEEMAYTPNLLSLQFTQLSAATTYYFNVVVRDEANNVTIYEGMGQETESEAPVVAQGRAIDAGTYHNCALNDTNQLYCWGNNFNSQIGNGTTDDQLTAQQIGGDDDWFSVAAGSSHSCAIKMDGRLFCWGANFNGQLGDNTLVPKSTPIQAGLDTDWEYLSLSLHTCAIKQNGALYCWGNNFNGQLGDGTKTHRTSITQIGSDTDWRMVAAGIQHSCAVKTDGRLYCWGYNFYGQLGDGTTTEKLSPTQVGTDSDWSQVAVGDLHTCAVKNDGQLYCWGENSINQLGGGAPTNKSEPTLIGSDWASVATGGTHTCALKTDRRLFCWGANNNGQIGDGNISGSLGLTQITANTDWIAVTLGLNHTCALKSDGHSYCWGANVHDQEEYFGQLGNGTTQYNNPNPGQVVGF